MHIEAAILVAGYFNAGKLKSILPHFYQHVTCATRGENSRPPLLHTQRWKALTRPSFGRSDHNSILLIPAYKQKLKQEVPVTRSVWKWYDEENAKLQDCFASTDWNMFWGSSNNKCVVIPTVTVCTYPNQKPWTTGNIQTELEATRGENSRPPRAATFKEQDSNPDAYNKSRYALLRAIKQSKQKFRTNIQSY